jgi:hypothetical protein
MYPTRRITMAALSAAMLAPALVVAQDCTALLQHGLRNIRIASSEESEFAEQYDKFCSKEYSAHDRAIQAHIEVSVFGFGGGGAGGAVQDRNARLREWCGTNQQRRQRSQAGSSEVREFYADAVQAWNRCNELVATNRVEVVPTISTDQRTVDVSLRYTGPAAYGIQYLGTETRGFTCRTLLPGDPPREWRQNRTYYITSQAMKVRCDRAAATQRTGPGEQGYQVTPPGVISVLTAGPDLQLNFAERWDPPLPAQAAERLTRRVEYLESNSHPVGSVVATLMPLAAFAQIADTTAWKPADGRDAPAGSRYRQLIGQRLPDLRGMFLRGTNTFRPGEPRDDGQQDPDTDRAAGSYQPDALQSHKHADRGHGHGTDAAQQTGSTSADNSRERAAPPDPPRATIHAGHADLGDPVDSGTGAGAVRHGPETRPKNVAVYYYVRVN